MGHRPAGGLRAPAARGAIARRLSALAAAAPLLALASAGASITPFSGAVPGSVLPAPWRTLYLAGIKPAEIDLVGDAGATVLRVRAVSAAGSAAHALSADAAATPRLAWRWRVERAVPADWGTRAGDDFAARLYVAFDLPLAALPFLERMAVRLARYLHGDDVPTAALCYVWAHAVAPGTSGWNPYAPRVRMVVLRSGNGQAGKWVEESRDLEADFRAAFSDVWSGPVPRITGVAASSDTDQTQQAATAWFGDIRLQSR